ncbi:AAA domain-containing protein [Methylacidimicrobium sp. B4]|uniref:AAA domain-containing protein n=1 Tax=Methylacidimicrobium sp. B4 TaxID=2796139 RepID=UPI001A8E50A9|nr:AAA domain-containing protein [Methylacidimicrobium sp. B4]QSR84673.1 AAA family ATPase [Methylacidimicrobium sp. B4]
MPKELKDWVSQKFQSDPDKYVDWGLEDLVGLLNPQITIPVERRVPDPGALRGAGRPQTARVSEVRRLGDHCEIKTVWRKYLLNEWRAWAEQMRRWQIVQRVYEDVDFMRRRLEEAEERYELLLAVGLLQWRDSTGVTVKRHLLTAPAEISLDAVRGILTAAPGASFEKFRVDLDMLERQAQPRLDGTDLEDRLEELDVRAWDKASVAKVLRIIANKTSGDSEVSEDVWSPLERADQRLRILYAPALVLRERRPTVYEELIGNLLNACEREPAFSTTAPWERFISEGEAARSPTVGGADPSVDFADASDRLYFPRPTNEEQRRIIDRLAAHPYVLVKGPPGTGKSYTIANLICHLLATGERVLITAHVSKALDVLRKLLPEEIRNLCVTAFDSGREDHRLLEDSVRGILSRKNEWRGAEQAQSEIDRWEEKLRQLEDETAAVVRQLRELREAETHSHTLIGGYQGTAAQIARQVEKERERYEWFPPLPDEQSRCPLGPDDIEFLADVHAAMTNEHLSELRLEVGTFPLPDPSEFAQALQSLRAAEDEAESMRGALSDEYLPALRAVCVANLDACRNFLKNLEAHAARAESILGDPTRQIVKDLLIDWGRNGDRLERELRGLVEQMRAARERAATFQIDVPSDIEGGTLLADTRQRLEHFRNGGRRGWGFLAPRVVRETRYIEKRCKVNGRPPREEKSLDALLGFLELKRLLQEFQTRWPSPVAIPHSEPARAVDLVADLAQELTRLVEYFRASDRNALDLVPVERRVTLAEPAERTRWRRALEAELALRLAQQMRAPVEEWRGIIRGLAHNAVHPCMAELAQAIEDLDPARWTAAWQARQRLMKAKEDLRHYQELLGQLRGTSPELTRRLQSTQGNPEWKDRLRQLERAWAWAAARKWLCKVADPEHHEELTERGQRLQKDKEKTLEKLVALKAWHAFFLRLDDQTEQNLTAWTQAIARIGKGTGKYAYRHRTTARQYLKKCLPKMPCWIMPLHRLWATTDPTPGIFDTVIVDEASQAGIDALALLLLAKRIVVVGDDKQNSPEGVGVSEDDIARLARDHLHDFRFRDEFRPDTSLYDHAERAFGHPVSLREHFRCVPEIIRFSNDLCYTDAPLVPLRQPPPNRLEPLQSHFVPQGVCEGSGERILNRAEAEAIVERIRACIDDDTYDEKTMGVIVLQGHAQVDLIEKKLAEALESDVREKRKLRCGVPASFQGDQRDVIFLSLIVSPDHRFRALTEIGAQRRFNVAMSRARDQVWLFHSVQLHDLSREDLRWRLLQFFSSPEQIQPVYQELERLEHEALRTHRRPGSQPDPYESWFEVDVALELLRKNYRVHPQYEVAGYRIDLVVEGLSNRLAVECDGDAWHGPERCESDMARQRQLERAGWKFVRVRESEWYADRNRTVCLLERELQRIGIRPVREEVGQEEVE